MVLKRAWPCSSRLVPVGALIGFSGALSSVGARVFSAQSFSDAAGWRPSKTSEIGLSATVLRRSAFGLFSGIQFPTSVPATTLMIEEDRQAAKCATDRVVGEREGLPCASLSVLRVLCGKGFLSLDAAFRAHLFLTFFQRTRIGAREKRRQGRETLYHRGH